MLHKQAPQIVLASASPRRRELLAQINVSCHPHAVDIDESPVEGESASIYVQRLALQKAQQAVIEIKQKPDYAALLPLPVLGSDTCIEHAGEILGKPLDSAHASRILSKLSGRTHYVHTAVAILAGADEYEVLSSTQVSFSEISDADIENYVATEEPMGKAGAYAIQGRGAQFIQSINGSYTGVMGLPLYETAELLRKAGINPIANR